MPEIITMERGRIRETGTFNELATTDGPFARLAKDSRE